MVPDISNPFTVGVIRGAEHQAAAVADGATAVIAFNDLMAIGVLQRLREPGIRVPQDVSVVGCDDIFGADFCSPSLTTVAAPLAEIGRSAVQVLLDIIGGKRSGRPRPVVRPTQLVVRESTGAALSR